MASTPNAAVLADDSLIPGVSPAIYGASDFGRIAALMRRETGVVLDERKRMLAYSRLAPLVRKSGLKTFAAYLDLIAADQGQQVLAISALTTNHTYFNREPHHFEHFTRTLRPELLARAEAGEPIRIWSAGCSSGEEIWTLMMMLLGEDAAAGRRIAKRDIIALASDIALDALAAAKAATYSTEAISAMPEPLRRLWCQTHTDPSQGEVMIGPELRSLVRFRQLNLFASWPFRRPFDVIFCRNVMIYFDLEAKEQLVLALARQLRPGGFLYIGHSERVTGEAASLLDCAGPTIYQRRST
jgi:chemotaxis protein methyltransferase CheR